MVLVKYKIRIFARIKNDKIQNFRIEAKMRDESYPTAKQKRRSRSFVQR
jgi:hypothetical protein